MLRTILLLSLSLIFTNVLLAQEPAQPAPKIEANDKLVAAGIALKTGYIFRVVSGDNAFESVDFSKALSTISKDAESFSDSKIGNRLRANTERIRKTLTLLMTEQFPPDNKEFLKLLNENNINTDTPDPNKIAALITTQVREYISQAQLPGDIFRFPDSFHDLDSERHK